MTSKAKQSALSEPQIFVADDNLEFAQFVQRVSARAGWSVSICQNGAELLSEVLSVQRPAFVLVDLMMPEMDGIETIKKLSEIDLPLRVRFMTGGAASNADAAEKIGAARGLNLGPTVYKPVTLEELKDILEHERQALDSPA